MVYICLCFWFLANHFWFWPHVANKWYKCCIKIGSSTTGSITLGLNPNHNWYTIFSWKISLLYTWRQRKIQCIWDRENCFSSFLYCGLLYLTAAAILIISKLVQTLEIITNTFAMVVCYGWQTYSDYWQSYKYNSYQHLTDSRLKLL